MKTKSQPGPGRSATLPTPNPARPPPGRLAGHSVRVSHPLSSLTQPAPSGCSQPPPPPCQCRGREAWTSGARAHWEGRGLALGISNVGQQGHRLRPQVGDRMPAPLTDSPPPGPSDPALSPHPPGCLLGAPARPGLVIGSQPDPHRCAPLRPVSRPAWALQPFHQPSLSPVQLPSDTGPLGPTDPRHIPQTLQPPPPPPRRGQLALLRTWTQTRDSDWHSASSSPLTGEAWMEQRWGQAHTPSPKLREGRCPSLHTPTVPTPLHPRCLD